MDTMHILLADDHTVVRAGIRKVLEDLPGRQVIDEAGDGPQVFEALGRTPYDILLLDVHMPGFDPISSIRKIRQAYPQMKILVISAYDDDIYVQGMLGAGVHGYHLKDQPLSDMLLAVQRVLAGERWVSSPLLDRILQRPVPGSASSQLSERQREMLQFLRQGMSNQEIANHLGISVKTVENHLTRLYRALKVSSRLEAVRYTYRYPEILGRFGEEVSRAAAEVEQPAGQCPTILVVDDNGRYRRQLCQMVGRLFPQAVLYEADTIASAVHLSRQLAPDLVLLDVILGEEDGIACVRRIRSVSEKTRVVLISAYPDREFHRRGVQAGAVAFVDKKDLDSAALRQLIEDLIEE